MADQSHLSKERLAELLIRAPRAIAYRWKASRFPGGRGKAAASDSECCLPLPISLRVPVQP
jgi:hypothetical protein